MAEEEKITKEAAAPAKEEAKEAPAESDKKEESTESTDAAAAAPSTEAESKGDTKAEEADKKPEEVAADDKKSEDDSAAGDKKTEDEKTTGEVNDAPQAPKEEAGEVKTKAATDSAEKMEVDEEKQEESREPSKPEILGRGRRARKSTEAYEPVIEETKKVEIPKGEGEKLEDMPRVVANFKKVTWSDPHLKMLHSVVFGMGKKKEFKAKLLQFNGLVYHEGKKELEQDRIKEKMYKLKMDELKAVMDLADIDRSAESFGLEKGMPNKEVLCNRFLEWLEKPHASDKKSKKTSAKRNSTGSAKGSAKKAKKETPAKKKSPAKSKSSEKKRTPPAKKASSAKVKRDSSKKAKEKKAAAKSPSKAKSSGPVELDIPGVDTSKVKEKVKSIVENANREELTVKGVRKLLEEWLDTDLSDHKDGIRSLVMEVM